MSYTRARTRGHVGSDEADVTTLGLLRYVSLRRHTYLSKTTTRIRV